MDESISYEYKKVRYTGDLARNAIALSNTGIGYVLLETGKDRGEVFAIVAYKQTLNGPIPEHVESLTDYEMKKVEKINDRRSDYGRQTTTQNVQNIDQNPPEYYWSK